MLKIRLSRTGKKSQPSFRIVVQEHTSPIKGKFIENIGYYRPADNPKVFKVEADRVKHWISVGAQPSDTLASLLKRDGFEDMDKYIDPKNKQAKKKKVVEVKAPATPPPAPVSAPAETAPVASEASDSPSEDTTPAEEAPVVEETPSEETPVVEETPQENAEEAPQSEEESPKEEETPAS